MPIKRINAARDALSRAEQVPARRAPTALSQLATQLTTDARTSTDQAKMQLLIGVVTELGK
jgi:hypothetical protein